MAEASKPFPVTEHQTSTDVQYAELAMFLADHGFGARPSYTPSAEDRLPEAVVDECRVIVASVLMACKRLANAELDCEELLTARFDTCALSSLCCYSRDYSASNVSAFTAAAHQSV